MAAKPDKNGFVLVRLETSGLPEESIGQINRALQKTLVSELAELAVMKGGRIDLGLPGDDRFKDLFRHLGRTDGIVAEFPTPNE
jgi:hypothetical protein